MKLIVVFLCAFAGCVLASSNTDIDWSTVRPLWEIKEWQDKHPAHMEVVRSSGLLARSGVFQNGLGGRIAGGNEADRHQFPYQVGVITHLAAGNSFCGGSLISRNYVMTAAHCLDTAASAVAVLGAHNIMSQSEEATQQRIFVPGANFKIYPNWNAQLLRNDMAVLLLPEEANYNLDYIRSVRLPNRRQIDVTFAGQLAVVSGWGRTTAWNSDLSTTLQYARLPVITNLACRTRFPTSVTDDHVCGDGGAGGPCQGDMGGPLSVVEADGRTTQIGIVSFGLGFSCEANWPSVYLRITSFLDWIDENTDGTISENWNN